MERGLAFVNFNLSERESAKLNFDYDLKSIQILKQFSLKYIRVKGYLLNWNIFGMCYANQLYYKAVV